MYLDSSFSTPTTRRGCTARRRTGQPPPALVAVLADPWQPPTGYRRPRQEV